ncbi:MAG: hypothetical protein ABSB39_23590, partial [Candidatus Sulfotelmatobacter sp.]
MRRGFAERDALVTDHVILDIEVQFRLRGVGLGIVNLVAVFRFAGLLQREIALSGDDFHFLISVGLSRGDPDANLFPTREISYGEGIVKREVAGFLGQGRQSERKKQR